MLKILLSLLLAGSLVGTVAAQPPVKIVVGYTPVVDELGAYVAIQEGYFAKAGLDVTLQQMPNGNSIPPGMLSGSLQIGAITSPTLIQSAAAGFPMKIVAGASYVSKANPNGWIVVRKGVTIGSPKDFEGKRVAIGAIGSFFDVLFRQWLLNNGVAPNKVTFVEVQFSSMLDLLRGGQVDAAVLGQPYLGRIVMADLGTEYAAYTGTFGERLLSNIYTATDQWIAQNAKAAAGFREAIEQADQFMQDNPEKARFYAAGFLKLPADVMGTLPLANYATRVEPQQIKLWSDMMLSLKMTDMPVDPLTVLSK